jgi:hypothetical protein
MTLLPDVDTLGQILDNVLSIVHMLRTVRSPLDLRSVA